MSIDEAIAMMHEWADYECYNEEQIQASEAFNQIAVWLEDYKRIKMLVPIEQALKAEYNKAIDDFVEHIRTYYALKQEMGYVATTYEDLIKYIYELAEQLKAGGNNES